MSMKLHFTAVFVVCLATRVTLDPRLRSFTCPELCKCEVDTNYGSAAKCNLNGVDSSTLINIQWPQDLFSLDLSSSGLKKLPTSFTRKLSNISKLNLSNNSLEDMTKESFGELKELRTLDLSYTKLRPSEFPPKKLSKLETLYVKDTYISETFYWPLILSLPRIQTVRDAKWMDACDQCNITKTLKPNTTFLPKKNYSKTRLFYIKGKTYQDSSGDVCLYFYSLIGGDLWEGLNAGFALECWCDLQRCAIDVAQILEIFKRFALSLRLTQRLLDCLYPLASVALLINSIVISFILKCNDLRKSPTMLLILNMAVCDVFMSIWCILTATYNTFLNRDEEVKTFNFSIWKELTSVNKYCPYMAFIYGVTQTVAMVTSVFLVVEKYLVIVYSMQPAVRITKKIAIRSTAIIWCVVIAYFVYGVFFVDRDTKSKNLKHNRFLCTLSGGLTKSKLLPELSISVIISWIGFFFICCTIPLYIHIYIVVRRSSHQMGIKREGTLAKRLAILIVTNVLFSTIPMAFVPFASSQLSLWQFSIFLLYGPNMMKILLITCVWTPVLLLCLNSSLNPYLFAFRHRLFQRCFIKTIRKFFPSFQTQPNQNIDQQMRQRRGRRRVMAQEMDVAEETHL